MTWTGIIKSNNSSEIVYLVYIVSGNGTSHTLSYGISLFDVQYYSTDIRDLFSDVDPPVILSTVPSVWSHTHFTEGTSKNRTTKKEYVVSFQSG